MSHEIQQYGSRLNGGAGAPAVAEVIPTPKQYTLAEMEVMAQALAASRLFGEIATAERALALMLLCDAEGLHPVQAMKRYHIIEGRPSMRADAMQAEFQARGGRLKVHQADANVAHASFSHPVLMPDAIEIRVTYEDCKAAGITVGKYGEKDNWKKFRADMLWARMITRGIRRVYPGIVAGIYAPEELEDARIIEAKETPAVPTPTPAPAIAPPSAKPQPKRSDAAPPDTWENHMRTAKAACDAAWRQSLADHGITEGEAGEWGTLIARDGYHRIVNHIITAALEAGYITQPQVGKDENVAVRDADKAKKVVKGLYEADAAWVRGQLAQWIDKRRVEAEAALGWTAVEGSQDEPGDGLDDEADARAEFGPGADG